MRRFLQFIAIIAVAWGITTQSAPADDKVILTIDGKIGSATPLSLDFEMLSGIGHHTIKTTTKWTDGTTTFEGPLLRDVLKYAGANGKSIRAVAINDYAVTIPVTDALDHDVILAHTADGKRMRIRDKGPLWIIYPWSDKLELHDERIFTRSIWQLNRLELR